MNEDLALLLQQLGGAHRSDIPFLIVRMHNVTMHPYNIGYLFSVVKILAEDCFSRLDEWLVFVGGRVVTLFLLRVLELLGLPAVLVFPSLLNRLLSLIALPSLQVLAILGLIALVLLNDKHESMSQ